MKMRYPKDWKFIWILLAVLWFFSLVTVSAHVAFFDLRPYATPLHMILVSIAYIVWLITNVAWAGVTRSNTFLSKTIPVLSLFLISFFLLQLYISNWVSMENWGENITLAIYTDVLSDLPALIQTLPFEPAIMYATLYGVPLLYLTLVALFSNRIYDSLLANYNTWEKYKYRNRLYWIGGISAILFSIVITLTHRQITLAAKHHGEPIYSFFSPVSPSFNSFKFDLDVVKAIEDSKIKYKNNSNPPRKNVIIIAVDAMRSDHMSLYGYERKTTPYLDSLVQSQGMEKVDYMVSNCASSSCGILSILGSKKITDLSFGNYKISDVLADLGYKVNYILGGTHKSWLLHRYYNFHHTPNFYKEGTDSQEYTVRDDRAMLEFLDMLGTATQQGNFFYFHMMSSHMLGVNFPEYQKYTPVSKTTFFNPDHQKMLNSYDNGVFQADAMLQKILNKLQSLGYLEDALVVITADHGEAVGENGKYKHGGNVYNENTNIPLLFYDTNGDKVGYNDVASQVDIAPIILQHLGVECPVFWDGSATQQDSVKYIYQQQKKRYAIIRVSEDAIMKYTFFAKTGKDELFDVSKNRIETDNLIDVEEYAALVEEFRAKFKANFDIPK